MLAIASYLLALNNQRGAAHAERSALEMQKDRRRYRFHLLLYLPGRGVLSASGFGQGVCMGRGVASES